MTKFCHIGDIDHLPVAWRRIRDENRWPGTELEWIWCHPTLSLLLLQGVVYEVSQVYFSWRGALGVAFALAALAILIVGRLRV